MNAAPVLQGYHGPGPCGRGVCEVGPEVGVTLDALGALVEHARIVGDRATSVTGIAIDHREIRAGDLFAAVPGRHVDGRDFAAEAVRRGAVAVLTAGQPVAVGVPQLVVPRASLRTAVGRVAHRIFGDPSSAVSVIGVTGTNGKTTTVSVVSQLLERLGEGVGVLGTLWSRLTTPEAPELARRLAEFRDSGRRWVAMEVSSIAIAMERIEGLHVRVGVFTNLSQDHLDFHGSMEDYFAAKARLFEPERTAIGVINVDDPWGARLAASVRVPVVPVSISAVTDIEIDAAGIRFRRNGRWYRSRLVGEHNLRNILLAVSVLEQVGFDPDLLRGVLGEVESPRGRMQRILGPRGLVVVDYAHSPDALAAVLRAARLLVGPRGRLLVVFGAGGERDQAKRPLMGAVAEQLADVAIVTSDNPRSEDPAAIAAQIVAGWRDRRGVRVVLDRRAAIEEAVAMMAPGDVLVVAGKGHERVQVIDGVATPFDDIDVVHAALQDDGGLLA
ncbi:UDP-N-acetylmuramyl-tripeptide synthetase [Acidimicrobium ferrooxidans DSM 10331]|uniref:UDP-N-acetylmuramoyl-L-alanyl-D-glutamate--2,6-diaminopimelate ligase n=1 Tax=Acidimicrobium ferrooxidans (strain DSM 10331 / JCM 15462 / NBRC 103882 / ICP) TaxID=525909 RepID=C7LZM2_ACIFD|nr:UDP-N-acetylmuramyl-tripeptide synthetase [Acidimicrobium ferrooxidans DSM 10331]